jgi:hypothetical protein
VIDPLLRQILPAITVEEQPAALLEVGSTWNRPEEVSATPFWRTMVEDGETVNAPHGEEV